MGALENQLYEEETKESLILLYVKALEENRILIEALIEIRQRCLEEITYATMRNDENKFKTMP